MTVRCSAYLIAALLVATLFSSNAASCVPSDPPAVVGNWEGRLKNGSTDLRIGYAVSSTPDGKIHATLDSIDQGLKDLVVDEATFEDGKVHFFARKYGIEYNGKLDTLGKKIEGHLKQGPGELPLDLLRTEKLPELNRPQTPKPPFPYLTEDVDYDSLNDAISLGATLVVPNGPDMKPPFPAVVLITGSGQQDRDESLLGHKPFLVLADHLARHGIAVLRADDRGIGGSTGRFESSTSLDFADDALGGVAYLKTRPEIDTKRIGLIGHSEGGFIAPLCAAKSEDVAFIVLLAGTGVPGKEISIEQSRLISLAEGRPEDQVAIEGDLGRKMIDLTMSTPIGPELGAKLNALIASGAKSATPETKWIYEDAAQTAGEINAPWFKMFFSLDPRKYLEQVKCPVLALNGAKDLQVPPMQNIPPIEAALKKGGNTRVVAKILPDLNHLFQKCKTGSPSEYASIEMTFDPGALAEISSWIMGL